MKKEAGRELKEKAMKKVIKTPATNDASAPSINALLPPFSWRKVCLKKAFALS
jgi:phosphoribosylpyrophosphate synthetase